MNIAAVVWGPGEPFVIEEVEVDPPQWMEVRIKILFTSICHTDLSAWKGEVRYRSKYMFVLISDFRNYQFLFYFIIPSTLDHLFITSFFHVHLQNEQQRAFPRILGHEASG